MITLYNVTSSDGYIADKDGKEDFIPDEVWQDFLDLCNKYEVVAIGRKTYETIQSYENKNLIESLEKLPIKKVVLTRDENFVVKSCYQILHSVKELLSLEELIEDKMLVSSGPDLYASLLNHNLVDMVILNVLPIPTKGGTKPFITDLSLLFNDITEEKKPRKRKLIIYRKSKIQQISDLIDQADLLTHKMDPGILKSKDESYADTVLTEYAGWKVKCIEQFSKDEIDSYKEYYSAFAKSDSVSDLSNLALKNTEMKSASYKKTPPISLDSKTGEITIGAWSVKKIDSAREGLDNRRKAMIGFLKDLKSKILVTNNGSKKEILLTISKKEGFCMRDNNNKKICYPVHGTRNRIIFELTRKSILTKDLANTLEIKQGLLMSEIGGIRRQIRKCLGLNGHEVIKNKKPHGYCIGEGYRIEKV